MDDESLFAAHARFKAGEEMPDGWYRAGEALGEGAWVVDLDLFVEIELSTAQWAELPGDVLELELGDEVFEIDVPADATLEECWSLPGAGLFEAAPGASEEELEEAEAAGELESLGRFGDLHVVPRLASA